MAEKEEEENYTILSLIYELNKVVDAHGDLPVYIMDDWERAEGHWVLSGFELFEKKNSFPFFSKRIVLF